MQGFCSVPCHPCPDFSRVSRVSVDRVSCVSRVWFSVLASVPCQPCRCQPPGGYRLTAYRVSAYLADFVCGSSYIVLKMQCVKCMVLFHAVSPVSRFQACQACPRQPCQPWQACLCQCVGLCAMSVVSVSAVSRFIPCCDRVNRAATKSVSPFFLAGSFSRPCPAVSVPRSGHLVYIHNPSFFRVRRFGRPWGSVIADL